MVIDSQLAEAGWVVLDRPALDLSAGLGVAVREMALAGGGFADYLLFVEGRAVGVLEAKKVGHALTGVEVQTALYASSLPRGLMAPVDPLPFQYESTGVETRFTNGLDPKPRSRLVFRFHRPETLAEWLSAEPLASYSASWYPLAAEPSPDLGEATRPSSLRSRLQRLPPVPRAGLWNNQREALERLEHSLRQNRPRSLIQMATGSGKTIFAVSAIYRLIKFGGARRVLFLVDRDNLGRQAEDEFAKYRTPDDYSLFTSLYPVQRLRSRSLQQSSKVVITTIQRFYSMLQGEPEFDDGLDEGSLFARPELDSLARSGPLPVVYNPHLPPETFDVVFIDECHRSIYTLWRQVLEYFDAFLIGLTATPAAHTYGFFNSNVVMEFSHERAVGEGANVPGEVYRILTRISREGATVEAGAFEGLPVRDKRTREMRWKRLDEDLTYDAAALDRAVVAKDQIRLVVRTFRDRLFTEIFPGRTIVPKTLIFAKDDSHAEDIVEIVREELGEGNDFCQKITYKTTGKKPEDLIQDFRNSFYPRIAVTVDMIATGTDIKPVEIVMFLRTVKSQVLFEQMVGRGVRTINADELRQVTPDAGAKTHFVVVDCVGLDPAVLVETQPLERKRGHSLAGLLELVALRTTDEDVYRSLAGRLARLDRELEREDRERLRSALGGKALGEVVGGLMQALDEDHPIERARLEAGLGEGEEPSDAQLDAARLKLLHDAAAPLATKPAARQALLELRARSEQWIDEVSRDVLVEVGASAEATAAARSLVASFEEFLATHRDELAALRFFYSVPHRERLRFQDVKALAEAIEAPPRSWTPERIWHAYELLRADRVHRASPQRLLTDVVSLVRFALHRDEELVPFPERVEGRFRAWMLQQENAGRTFNAQQRLWLEKMRDHIATSVEIDVDDFEFTPFAEEGGLGRAREVFPGELETVMRELNEVLAA